MTLESQVARGFESFPGKVPALVCWVWQVFYYFVHISNDFLPALEVIAACCLYMYEETVS